MYNGIGLTSVRGSGTSGYVQRNLSHVSRQRKDRAKSVDKVKDFDQDFKGPKAANPEILDHNRKREVEVKVMRLRETLEEQGVDDDEVDAKCDKLRASLLAKLPPPRADGGGGSGAAGRDTHADAAKKSAETAQLKSALGIKSDYVGGSAFDRELQLQLKEERMAKREAEDEARREAEAALAREQEREEKRRRKEERRAEKEAEKEAKKKRRREDEDRRRRSPSRSRSRS